MTKTISADFPYKSHYVDLDGSKMHYIKEGEGDPILLLHGVPGSSYVWRNIIPHLAALGCCIAPDLIGFGKSGKPDIAYTIADHIHYIDRFIETLNLDHMTIVMHGWGSIIGLDYAMRHENKCKGLVFYESYLRPLHYDDMSLPYQEQILSWQEQENMNATHFVEKVLSQSAMRQLSEKELNYYREPFVSKGSEKPLLQYLNELPTNENANTVSQIIANYSNKLAQSSLPKLMLYSVPGFITTMATAVWAKNHLSHLEVVEVGEEMHYAQESNPTLMGEAISIWLQGIDHEKEFSTL